MSTIIESKNGACVSVRSDSPAPERLSGWVERGGDRREPPQPRDRKPQQAGYSKARDPGYF